MRKTLLLAIKEAMDIPGLRGVRNCYLISNLPLLVAMVDSLYKDLDEGSSPILVPLHPFKTFDIVNHNILLYQQ